jgi:antitoxin HicB
MTDRLEYPVVIAPLAAEDGGGFSAVVPDLPGCMSDGETPEEAIANVQDAIASWIEAAHELGRSIPRPSRKLAFA